jgi:hypothetical protein
MNFKVVEKLKMNLNLCKMVKMKTFERVQIINRKIETNENLKK